MPFGSSPCRPSGDPVLATPSLSLGVPAVPESTHHARHISHQDRRQIIQLEFLHFNPPIHPIPTSGPNLELRSVGFFLVVPGSSVIVEGNRFPRGPLRVGDWLRVSVNAPGGRIGDVAAIKTWNNRVVLGLLRRIP